MPQRKSKAKPPSSERDSADTSAPSHIVRVGPAGWSYPDWAGYVYPSRRAKGFHEATYLAEYFDTIEINTSFYQPFLPDHPGPSAQATSAVGYVRLHGRRYDTWFTDDETIPAYERYNYLYTVEELAPWVTRVGKVTERARETFVITNNHFQGKAVVNALQLINILKASKVKVPEPLLRQYPQLEEIADAPPAEPMLFPMGRGSKDVTK